MRNKRMQKLLSKVQKSRVVNYTRTHQSSYVFKQSWAWRARVVLGEFWNMINTSRVLFVQVDETISKGQMSLRKEPMIKE